ncbi:MAG: exodeoxyribonuclease VII small subunit [Burkholderiaceae bacterium]|jgi:exodeoxyribonuclease VII small subunit|nr:exodeoxyribonuclease VII small subunit [Burkholderiaceae bacterium]
MSDNTESQAATATGETFESAMAELNRLVAQMEEGELPLEAAIAAYQRGVALVRYCTAQLEKVDRQIEVLDREMLKPFEADNTAEGK